MYKGLPGEVKTFFERGCMFPNEEEFSSAPVHGAVGPEGYSSLLGTALHSGIASEATGPPGLEDSGGRSGKQTNAPRLEHPGPGSPGLEHPGKQQPWIGASGTA